MTTNMQTLTVETKRIKRSLDSVSLKLNGKRISLRNLEDSLDAPRTRFVVINEYSKEFDCRRAQDNYYGYYGTSPEGYTIHFNTLEELVKHYACDNIIRTDDDALNSNAQIFDELPTIKPRALRDSINRAIKQCCKNRVCYLKSHNSEKEKYEYELLHLLQGVRRELDAA